MTSEEKAIESINLQLSKLKTIDDYSDSWKFITAEKLKKYLGEKSLIYSFVAQFTPDANISFHSSGSIRIKLRNDNIEIVKNHLRDAIAFIEENGLHYEPKPQKENLFSGLNNWKILLSFIAVIGFTITTTIGIYDWLSSSRPNPTSIPEIIPNKVEKDSTENNHQ